MHLKCDGTCAETRFRLSAKWTNPFKSAGRGDQFSRLLAAEVCASAVVMLDKPCSKVVWRVLATHPIRQFPLHFPSRVSPCSITFQMDSTSMLDKRLVVKATFWLLYPRKENQYQVYRRLGGPWDWSGQVQKTSSPTSFPTPEPPAQDKSLLAMLIHPQMQCSILYTHKAQKAMIIRNIYV
jgi:hypothetical protein